MQLDVWRRLNPFLGGVYVQIFWTDTDPSQRDKCQVPIEEAALFNRAELRLSTKG